MIGKRALRSRVASLVELFLLLGGVPLLALLAPGPLFWRALLWGGSAYAFWRLLGQIDWRHTGGTPPAGWWRGPALRAFLVALCLLLYVLLAEPERLFELPRKRPGLWLFILFAYPPLSALPQELVFRVYFFEAHAGLWTRPCLAAAASALFFAWAHIVFVDGFAMLATALGGLLLARTYLGARARPGALWVVTAEHSLYGIAMFTLGLGGHFALPA